MTSATREKIVSLIFSPKGEKLQWILPVQKVKSGGKLKGAGYYLTLTTLDVYQPFALYVSLVIDSSSGNSSSSGISGFSSVGLNLSGWGVSSASGTRRKEQWNAQDIRVIDGHDTQPSASARTSSSTGSLQLDFHVQNRIFSFMALNGFEKYNFLERLVRICEDHSITSIKFVNVPIVAKIPQQKSKPTSRPNASALSLPSHSSTISKRPTATSNSVSPKPSLQAAEAAPPDSESNATLAETAAREAADLEMLMKDCDLALQVHLALICHSYKLYT